MKKIDRFICKLVGKALSLGLVLLAMQAGAESIPQVVQVVQVKGNARYATDNKTWHALKQGDILQPGVIIQTATNSTVDIELVDRETTLGLQTVVQSGNASPYAPPSTGLVYSPEEPRFNIVRIFESSVLAIDKLLVERTGVDDVAETQLDLQAGRIIGNVKKLSAASKYEIKIPNGVAGIRGSFYDLNASSLLKMWSGSAILAIVGADGTAKTWLVNATYGFNPVEAVLFQLTSEERPDMPPGLDHGHGPPFTPPPYGPPVISHVR